MAESMVEVDEKPDRGCRDLLLEELVALLSNCLAGVASMQLCP